MSSISASRAAALCCCLLSVLVALPKWLTARDDAVLLAHPRPPITDRHHGRVATISHDDATMARIASLASDGLEASSLASSFDMYYEARLDGDCDPSRNAVVIGGTNGASWLMHPLVDALRGRGYCTLNFDHRVHGRSSSPPGELSVELLAEDAAAIIRRVFGGRPVHVYGWSLGGLMGYYLALEHPDLIKSISLQGITSCIGFSDADGNCDDSFHFLKWFSSRDIPMRLLGTELQGRTATAAVKMHATDETMYFFRGLSTETMTRTPRAWNRWQQNHYHERMGEIKVPTLLLAGEYDALMVCDEWGMRADAGRIGGPAEYAIFPGFSHFMAMEWHGGERGADLIADTLTSFHAKHFS